MKIVKSLNLTKLLQTTLLENINSIPHSEDDYYVLLLFATVQGLKESSLSKFKKIMSLGYAFQVVNSNQLCLVTLKDDKAYIYTKFRTATERYTDEAVSNAMQGFLSLINDGSITLVEFVWDVHKACSFFSRDRAAMLKELGIKSKKLYRTDLKNYNEHMPISINLWAWQRD